MRRLRSRRAGRALFLAALLPSGALAVGCAKPPPATTPVEARHIGTPSGVWFDEACTPSGPEVCGNAKDDNCNGLLDEGCGLVNGRVQFEVAWAEPTATVDLVIGDPEGGQIDGAHRGVSGSGFRLDRRCPQDACDGQNVDNVVLVAEAPLHGLYTVDVRLADAGKGSLPLRVQFGWRVGDRVATTTILLGSVDDSKRFTFEL
jgi:tRNA (guanosine-2'-O-)-methyltransferase